MTKRLLPWILVILFAAAGYWVWPQFRGDARAEAVVYRTATVQRGDVTQTVSASGPLSAVATVEVGSQVSGNIARLHVDFNDTVKTGQLLAEIDSSTYEARVFQADAELASVRATLELKQLNARRADELLAKQLIAQADCDQARSELRQQEAMVRIKEAALKSAQVDLARCRIHSPIDGTVISREIDVGQTVQANFAAPKLFALAKDLRAMQITANVSEADIGGVAPGQAVSFTVDAFPGRSFAGTVRQIRNNPTTTNNVVNYASIIEVSNEDLKLRPGMTANVTITTARRAGVLRVANGALRFRPPEGAAVVKAAAPGGEPSPPAPAAEEDEGADLDQMPAPIRERLLAEFDQNKDGRLDAGERGAMRSQLQARFGGGPPGGGFPGSGAPAAARARPPAAGTPQTRTLYIVAGKPDATGRARGNLVATPVRTGLGDSAFTEIVSGLEEGTVVATGTSQLTAAAVAPAPESTNPFLPKPPGAKSR